MELWRGQIGIVHYIRNGLGNTNLYSNYKFIIILVSIIHVMNSVEAFYSIHGLQY
jgi:hypothetical protein